MSDSRLSDFQVELANVFFALPESAGFLLAGGGALIAQGIVPRPTEDLDFFTSRRAAASRRRAKRSSPRSRLAGEATSWCGPARSFGGGRSPARRRFSWTSRSTVPPPALRPSRSPGRASLPTNSRSARRSRCSAVRSRVTSSTSTCCTSDSTARRLRKAAEADPGFDLAMFAATLRTHGRIQDQDFPDVGVPITDIRTYFDAWADEVDPR